MHRLEYLVWGRINMSLRSDCLAFRLAVWYLSNMNLKCAIISTASVLFMSTFHLEMEMPYGWDLAFCMHKKMSDSWSFCFSEALISSIGLQLVGPYDILAGKHKKTKSADLNFNLHWRFFYDPPEFQTIIAGDSKTQYHMGYFRYYILYMVLL